MYAMPIVHNVQIVRDQARELILKGGVMRKFGLGKLASIVFLFYAAAVSSHAQTFTTLLNFDSTDGGHPMGARVQGTDGNFYGITDQGGPSENCTDGCGTVFKITSGGTLTTLHSFDGTDGADGLGLIQATDGNFYGTTAQGGTSESCTDGCGTVFKMTSGGTLTTLHSFGGTDGAGALGLIQATDGDFYGTTLYGGTGGNCPSSQTKGCGTVFKITTAGKLTPLYNFCSQPNCTDGAGAWGLIQATNGNFYGTTGGGGSANCTNGCGTIFEITPAGALTTLYSFCAQTGCADGTNPGELVQGTDGNFYGATAWGGTSDDGTVFKITAAGELTTLDSFDGTDGLHAHGPVQATDGNFYGTTGGGGGDGDGTVFEITPEGTLTMLHSFDGTDGASPGGPVQATNGNFYGTTSQGGNSGNCTDGCGTVWSLSTGLGPFVQPRLTMGKVASKITILGNNLTGSTKVSFDGVAATTFKVVSATEMTATVPSGALTGTLSVTTPSGTLNSNGPFYVTPQLTKFTPTSGDVGASVTITGVSLTQTSAVSFNGVAASFTVNSDAQVTATVPTGATTGTITITTAGGVVTSKSSFTVK